MIITSAALWSVYLRPEERHKEGIQNSKEIFVKLKSSSSAVDSWEVLSWEQNLFLSSAGDRLLPWSVILIITLRGPNEMGLVVWACVFCDLLVHALEQIFMDCLVSSTACSWDYDVMHSLYTIIPIPPPHMMDLSKFSPEGEMTS